MKKEVHFSNVPALNSLEQPFIVDFVSASERTVDHFLVDCRASQPLDQELKPHIASKCSAAPISSDNSIDVWPFEAEATVGFEQFAINRFLIVLLTQIKRPEGNGINGCDVFLCLLVLIVLVLMLFTTVVGRTPAISLVLEVLLVSGQEDALIRLHSFA